MAKNRQSKKSKRIRVSAFSEYTDFMSSTIKKERKECFLSRGELYRKRSVEMRTFSQQSSHNTMQETNRDFYVSHGI